MTQKQAGGTIELQIHNYGKVHEMHIVLVPGINEIGGANGAGKSTALNAVANIFGGKKLTPADPINEGAEGFDIKMTHAELGLVLRRIGVMKDGVLDETLIITEPEGVTGPSPLPRPQEILNRLLGGHSVTLGSLMEMKKEDRIELLRQIGGLDFTALEAERDRIYAERTRLNAEAQAFINQYEAIPDHGELQGERVDVSKLMATLDEIREANEADYQTKQEADKTERLVDSASGEYELAKKELAAATEREADAAAKLALATKAAKQSRAEVAALPDRSEELRKVQDKIAGAGEVNKKFDERDSRAASVAAFNKKKDASQAITNRLGAIEAEKKAAIAGAKLPGGLIFDENGVYLNGHPLEQASQVEIMDVDVALAVARNPKVPIILINQGSLYDKGHREALDKLAKKMGVYIMFERVIDTLEEAEAAKVSVFMKDGVGVNIKEGSDG